MAGLWFFLFGDLPGPEALPNRLNTPSIRITDRSGRLLYEVLAEEGGRNTVVPLAEIPPSLVEATIATEDSNFYQHPGVDWQGILRSFWINLRGGETLAGGSTLTQQVARTLLLSAEERSRQTIVRKLREAYLAWQLTRRYSKDEILAFYLNQMYYGGMAYGVEAAAQTYFGKPVSQLDLAEAALLAGLPQAPALYNPFTDAQAAQERQHIVLGLMEREGYISQEERQLAERETLVFSSAPYPLEAPHFVIMVRSQLDELLSEADRQRGGLTVRTTLDLDWQRLAENAIRQQIEELNRTPDGLGHNLNNAALVALDPRTGEILTMVGSPDYDDAEHGGAINMALSLRQPGSALKPFIFAAAFSPGLPAPWSAATSLLDVRTSFLTQDGKSYTPVNYDQLEHGPVLAREALASSLNIPAVITLEHVGIANFLSFASHLGLDDFGNPQEYDLSLALGGGVVRLLDLTTAYAVLANEGNLIQPYAILDIHDAQGEVLYTSQATPAVNVIDPRIAWLISDILSDNEARTLGFGRNSVLRLDRPAAVKTGTTSNFHDNWTVGYTPQLVVGVWAGNTDYQPMRDVSGVAGAAPIWHQFMRNVLVNIPAQEFNRPDGLVQVEVCILSGLLPTPDCPYTRLEWFIQGTEPVAYDSYFQRVLIDQDTGKIASDNTPPERKAARLAIDLPSQAFPWARSQGLLLLVDLQASTMQGQPNEPPLRLLSPADQSVYFINQEFSTQAQRILIEAVSTQEIQRLMLWVDTNSLATLTQPPYQAFWQLEAGLHTAWAEAILMNGSRLTSPPVTFEVKK